jgi:hypothetical protein
MKVAQLRRVLEVYAAHRSAADQAGISEALCKLAEALRPADKMQVAKAVEKLRDNG